MKGNDRMKALTLIGALVALLALPFVPGRAGRLEAQAAEDPPAGMDGTQLEEPEARQSPLNTVKEEVVGTLPSAAAPGTGSEEDAPAADSEDLSSEPSPAAEPADASGDQGSGGLLKKGMSAITGWLPSKNMEGEEGAEEEPKDVTPAKEPPDETEAKVGELRRLAVTNAEKRRVSETIRNINDLITLKPYEADYHFALALTLRRQGKYRDALQKYQDVLELGGPKPLVALLRAEAYAAQSDKAKAYEMLKEAAIGGRNIINDVVMMPLLQPLQTDTDFIKLALQLERFTVQRAGRPDPMTNPFPMVSGGDGVASGNQKPDILTPEQQQELLRETKKIHEQIQLFIKLQDEKKAMAAYLQLKEHLDKQKLLTIPRIRQEFKVFEARLKDIEVQISGIRLRYYYGQAKQKIDAMKELFSDGDYNRVMNVQQEILTLAREMVAANPKYQRVADEILGHSQRLVDRAKIRLEFQAQKPEIQGIIISGDAKMTIINDRIVKQGENVDDYRVVKVESNRVTFRYKGEEIPLVFRRY